MKEIGLPKNAPKSVKMKDEAMDKKMGVREGSVKDLKADRMMMFLSMKKKKKK